jgi:hypothetical protein
MRRRRDLRGTEENIRHCRQENALIWGKNEVRKEKVARMIIIATVCKECPFSSIEKGKRVCNISLPKHRAVETEDDRPFWCRLRKEQVIVRDFK